MYYFINNKIYRSNNLLVNKFYNNYIQFPLLYLINYENIYNLSLLQVYLLISTIIFIKILILNE